MLNLQGELDRLFHPISPRAFFSRYWERRSLLIAGARDKFAHVGGADGSGILDEPSDLNPR